MLLDTLKKENMQALKDKDQNKRGILSIVINKCMLLGIEKKTKGEELVDADVLQLVNKTIKELDEEIKGFTTANRIDKVEELTNQKNYLTTFLPRQMTEEEIKNEILKLEDKTMPSIMKHFKANFTGLCDMKLVGEITKKL